MVGGSFIGRGNWGLGEVLVKVGRVWEFVEVWGRMEGRVRLGVRGLEGF